MVPRILSVASPLFVYLTLAALIQGLWREKKKLEWPAVVLGLAGLLASFIFLPAVHRLFFDEDIYIAIASNLMRAPVAQITLLGSPRDVQVSSYYKEGSGWPVVLSLIFLITGRSETAAFIVARVFFAILIAAVYQLARAILETRRQAVLAAVLFGATPVCFWFSPSAGTDIPAALFGVLGMWGLVGGNGMLAAAGFALAAQTRLELIVLVPLVWLSGRISWKWKFTAAGLVAAEILHLGWVRSIARVLEEAEKVKSAFSLDYVAGNMAANLGYLFNPLAFPVGVTMLGILGAALSPLQELARGRASLRVRAPHEPSPGAPLARHPLPEGEGFLLILQILVFFGVYLLFYAGGFNINPRYTIQMLAPLAVLAGSVSKRTVVIGALLVSTAIPYLRPMELPTYVQTLAADHRISVEFASHLQPNDLVVSTEPEVFLNQGKRVMNAVYASLNKARLEEELRHGRVIYHSGVRTNRPDTEEWRADQWVKSNFELHLIDSREIRGMRIAFYEMLLQNLNRETR